MTSAPWLVYDCMDGDRRVLRVKAGASVGGGLVAEVGPVGDPRAEADAAVISAAPDLVELAQDLLAGVPGEDLRTRAREVLARMKKGRGGA